jgi:predicted transcriptional regulator
VLVPIKEVLAGREQPQCIERHKTIGEAIRIMIERGYSQLPVLDAQNKYIGIISEQNIVRRVYHVAGYKELLSLSVDHFETPGITLSPEEDIFKALDYLRNVSAVTVLDGGKPVGNHWC